MTVDPPVAPTAAAPPALRYCVWFDWAIAALMVGLALGQLGREWASRADLAFQLFAIPALLVIGEGLRRGLRWARVLQLVFSAGLTIPGMLALPLLVHQGSPRARINAVIAAVLVAAAGAALQLALLALPSIRRWMRDPRPARVSPWALAFLALPALPVGLGLQARVAAQRWTWQSPSGAGIRVRMPSGTREEALEGAAERGGSVHVLLGTEGRCSYVVSSGRLPSPREGQVRDAAAWRASAVERLTAGGEVLARSPVVSRGPATGEGEEVRFRRDGVEHTFLVLTPGARFVVMGRTCRSRLLPPPEDGFFESLQMEPR